MTILLCIE